MRPIARTLTVVPAIFCAALVLNAQVATGSYPYGTFDNLGPDSVNVGNLNVHLSIPVLHKAGRGMPFTYDLSFDNSIWYPVTTNGTAYWTPIQNFGWRGVTEVATGYVSYTHTLLRNQGGCLSEAIDSAFIYHDTFGVQHPFSGSTEQYSQNCSGSDEPTLYATATDGSGYNLSVANYNQASLLTPRGNQIYPPIQAGSGAASTLDSNGNEITVNGSGQFTDTTGNVVLTVAGTPSGSAWTQTFTYKDTTGTNRQVKVNFTQKTVATNFGCTGTTEFPATPEYLVGSVVLGDGTSTYSFTYEQLANGDYTGRLSTVTLPQGGVITYTYPGANGGVECADGSTDELQRAITANSGSAASTWTYTRSQPNGTGTSHTEVVDGLSNHKEYDFVVPASSTQYAVTPATYYETSRQIYQGSASGTALFARSTCYNNNSTSCLTTRPALPLSQIDTYDTYNGIETDGVTSTYDVHGDPTGLETHDFGSTRGGILRNEVWTYNYAIAGLPSTDDVYDGSRNTTAETVYQYDNGGLQTSSGVPNHIQVTCPCGNLITETLYPNAGTQYNINNTYEDTGSLLTSTFNGGTTTLSYDSTFVYLQSDQLPTPSSGVSLSLSATYDTAYTGLPESSKDPNQQPTEITSYDDMLRPTEATYPDGGQTNWQYTPTSVTATIMQSSSANTTSEFEYDVYGRPSRSLLSNGQGTNPYYQQDTCYDADGDASFVSYTYQGSGSSGGNCTTTGDTYSYDALGRITQVVHADGTTQTWSYWGRATEFTDEYGNSRITQVDGLGRPTTVCEIYSGGALKGDSGSPASCGTDILGNGYSSTYSYSVTSGQIQTTVTQGAQTRTFQTDWLGRPTKMVEPESGTTTYSYAYNSVGLQVTRIRPQANQTGSSTTTTTTQYDSVGRVVSISYSDGTPTKTFAYDASAGWGSPTQSNLKGRLSYAQVPTAETIFSYDAMGRVTALGECGPSSANCNTTHYSTAYTYDWEGDRLTSSDGQGATETYTYSPANEILTITSSVSGSQYPPDLVSGIKGGPFGPTAWNVGNGTKGAFSYDSLGRVSGGSIICNGGTGCTNGNTLYSFSSGWKGTYLTSSSDSVEGQNTSYTYDAFGRLSTMTATSASFSYLYDRWGNRWNETLTSGIGPNQSLSFNTTSNNNQVTTSGYAYDAAGNMTDDGLHSYTYDAEGNVTDVDGGQTATYTYEALNHRVAIVTPTSNEEFIFNPEGQHTSSRDVVHGNVWNEWFFWGATPIGYYGCGTTYFQHRDWLGTERLQTGYNGQSTGTTTSLPFGDGFSTNDACDEQAHYAGLDHDNSADEHAQFREYSNMGGRWFSPDAYQGSYDLSNPQSLNRYAYVLNNPLGFLDPLGLVCYQLVDGGVDDEGYAGGDYFIEVPCGGAGGTSPAGGGSARAPNKPPNEIGTPKTTAQCSIYLDGSSSGTALYTLCSRVFPNDTFSQRMRGCLQTFYTPGSGYAPVPVIVPTTPGSVVNLDTVPGTGAHLGCLANTIQTFF